MGTAEGQPSVDLVAVAAEQREFAELLRRATRVTRLADWPVAYASLVETGAGRWLLVANGPGSRLAAQAAGEAMARVTASRILSTGLCGALDESLAVGALVHAAEVRDGQGNSWKALAPDAGTRAVNLLSLDRVVVTAREKRALAAATGCNAIEMEAAGVAAAAAASGAAFYCVRALSDTLREELPLDFNRYRDSGGRFARGRIAAACALRPWVVPGLLRFNRQCLQAAERLGECLVNARFD
jgi:adenosylhomocysteine nucleosidase